MKRKLLLVIITLLSSIIFITSCDVLARFGIGEHVHEYGEEWQSDESSHWKKCAKDGCQSETGKAEHGWGVPTVTEPEIVKEGKRIYVCTVCGKERIEIIPALEHVHTAGKEWISDDEMHWNECAEKDCEAKLNTSSHIWDDGTVIEPAASGKEGTVRYLCVVCKTTKNDTLPALPDKMSETEWYSYFDIDNVRIDAVINIGGFGNSAIVTLIDGEYAAVTSEGETYYSTSEEELSQIDFSGAYDSFNHLGENVYYAANVTLSDEEMDLELTDITITFADGKISDVAYTMDIFGISAELTFDLSMWGEVTVTFPEMTDEIYAEMLAPENFYNYTLNIDLYDAEYENNAYIYVFNGDDYSFIDYMGSGEPLYDTLENAGIVLNPILEVLYGLSAEDFVYQADANGFVCQSERLAEYGLSHLEIIVSEGYLTYAYAEYTDESMGYYYFESYGDSEVMPEEMTELDDETYNALLDPENYDVYSLGITTFYPDETYISYDYIFDGDTYYLTVISDDYVTSEGNVENAGVALNNILLILTQLSASDFTLDAEYGEYVLTDPTILKDSLVYFSLTVSDGYLSCVSLLYEDGTEEFYAFYDYGIHKI